jgi:hypothetical protein
VEVLGGSKEDAVGGSRRHGGSREAARCFYKGNHGPYRAAITREFFPCTAIPKCIRKYSQSIYTHDCTTNDRIGDSTVSIKVDSGISSFEFSLVIRKKIYPV